MHLIMIWRKIRNNMKNFLILTNEQKDPGFRISKQIQDYIEKMVEKAIGCVSLQDIFRKI